MAQNKQYKASITIGGAVSSAFKGALKETDAQISQLGSTIKALEARQQKFGTVAANLKTIGRDASMVSDRYREMGAQLERMRATQERLVNLNRASQANIARRDQLRGELVDAVALGASMALPIKLAADWEQRLAELNKVANATPDELNAIAQSAQRLAVQTGVAREEIIGAYTAAAQAGFAREEWAAFAETSAKMGVAFDTTGEQAGEMLKAWRSGMGLTMEQATELAGAANHLANNMNASAMGVGNVLQRQGAVFKAAGIDQATGAALAASLLSSGASDEVAATAGKNFVLALSKGVSATTGQKGALALLGFDDPQELARQMQEAPQQAIMEVLQSIKALEADEQTAVMTQLFGSESIGGIAPLIGNLDNLSRAFTLVGDRADYASSLQDEFAAMQGTTQQQAKKALQGVVALGTAIGAVLLPPINATLEVVAPLALGIAELAQEFPMVTSAVVIGTTALIGFKVASIAGGYAMTFVKGGALSMAIGFTRLQAGLQMATAGMRSLNLAMLMNPVGLVVAGIVAGGALIYKFWEPIGAFFGGFWDGFKEGMQPIMPMFNALGSVFQPVIDAVSTLWGWFTNLLEPVQLTSEGFEKATSAGQMFGQAVGTAISALLNPIGTVMDALGWIGQKLGLIDEDEQPPTGSIGAAAESAANTTVGNALEAGADALPENMQAGVDANSTTVNNQRSSASQQNTFQIQIVQQPGEDSEAFAQRTADIIEERRRNQEMAALYDGAQ